MTKRSRRPLIGDCTMPCVLTGQGAHRAVGIALGRSVVAHTIAILTCVVVPAETVNAMGLDGVAAQCAATPLMLRRWTPALSPATRVICSYPGKTAGTNFGATPSTLKLYPLGSKSTFLPTLTASVPVGALTSAALVLGPLDSPQPAAATANNSPNHRPTNSASVFTR